LFRHLMFSIGFLSVAMVDRAERVFKAAKRKKGKI
jgi:hypothetical protein